jgi:flagellar biosynthetic protein FliR
MGLNGAQLFDPSTSTSLSDLSRIYSDISILIFLAIGGHYVAIGQLSGLSQQIQPGSFMLSGVALQVFIDQTGRIFQIGCLLAAPVVVALLLTNFVLGIISKAVPTVNVFIISFPLTIGVGLTISIIALPEVAVFLEREFMRLPEVIGRLLQ